MVIPQSIKSTCFRFPPALSLMPSLRRSFSSPSVRSSPYPSTNSSIRTRAAPIHPRRGSPSATAERRVLADIEWWRVHDGQCDLDHTLEDPHEPDSDVPGGLVTLSAGGGSLEPPQTHSLSLDSMQVCSYDSYKSAVTLISVLYRMYILMRSLPYPLRLTPLQPPVMVETRQ